MAKTITIDLQKRVDAFDAFARKQDLIHRIFSDSLTENESKDLVTQPFYLYAYSYDSLISWNTNVVLASVNDSALDRALLIRNDKGVFIEKSISLPFLGDHKRLVVLFPVLITYPLENDYLRSHFAASDNIPVKTKIVAHAATATPGEYPVIVSGTELFSLRFSQQDVQHWTPDATFIWLLIASLLATISWLQLIIINIARKRSAKAGLAITLAIIAVLRISLYAYGLPFNLDSLTFFSPSLYASSKYLSSFGDLFISTLCLLWLVIYITRHTDYKNYFARIKGGTVRYILAVVLISALIIYVFLFVNLIRSLVLDSRIPFDVSHFYSVNIYTILGLLLVGIITGISCLVIYLFNAQFNALEKNKWVKYLLIAIMGMIWIFISGNNRDVFYWSLVGWLVLFIVLLDVPRLSLVSDLFEPHMIFWAVFICSFCTCTLQYFNHLKEQDARVAYVKLNLLQQRDDPAEYAFDKAADSMSKDNTLKSFFYKPQAATRKILNRSLVQQYLSGSALGKYEPRLYLFDANGLPLFNTDSTDYEDLFYEKNEASPTNFPYVFYKESILDHNYYLSYIKVYNDTVNRVIGYVFINMDPKRLANETVNSELLQPAFNKDRSGEYAHAVYINDKLTSQTNDYPFTTHLNDDTLTEQNYAFYTNNNISELYYKIADKRTVVVIHYHSELLEVITLFSYLFGMQVLLAIIILMYQLYLSYFTSALVAGKFVKFTLRRRVHLSMLGVVLLSFIIIGAVTVEFFTIQYQTSNKTRLQSVMQSTKQSVQNYLQRDHAFDTDHIFDSVSRSNRFKDFITSMANGQKIDINIFDDNGVLFNTSEDDIYNKGLLSNRMRPDAYYQLNVQGKSIVEQDERMAGLAYLSGYEPLRDEHGVTLGYVNVPLFSSEKDLNYQISNIVVTLINLYAFIFLISSIITVGITRWITRSFNIIIQQFGQLNLQQNERITWPYEDEIGVLVREYNKMVNKVEENAAMLAQSERETAWREMARQVAHEIKNPLTPMKLNIQYLQQAMSNDVPSIKELTARLSQSIIEQIDNLSYIASEFSNFAKMPEARPEQLELCALLNKAVELYLNEANITVTVTNSTEKLFVHSDRSQLLRVFTNLLENAKQAIPENSKGEIDVVVRQDDGDAIITITDNGAGIPEEVVKKIFQPYFTTKSSGTGLGLAMTRKIIEFWKGDIWFETQEGEGTTFFIRLPISPDPKTPNP